MEQSESRTILLSVLGIAILLLAVVGVTYAVFTFTSESNRENYISTGSISMNYIEGITNVMTITNAIPISDEVGMKQEDYFDFQIYAKIAGKTKINYDITVEKTNMSNTKNLVLNDDDIKLYLEQKDNLDFKKVKTPIKYSSLQKYNNSSSERVLYSGTFYNNNRDITEKTHYFKLRMWLSDGTEMTDKERSFKMKVNINAKV